MRFLIAMLLIPFLSAHQRALRFQSEYECFARADAKTSSIRGKDLSARDGLAWADSKNVSERANSADPTSEIKPATLVSVIASINNCQIDSFSESIIQFFLY
jgi:hypothetical protein